MRRKSSLLHQAKQKKYGKRRNDDYDELGYDIEGSDEDDELLEQVVNQLENEKEKNEKLRA